MGQAVTTQRITDPNWGLPARAATAAPEKITDPNWGKSDFQSSNEKDEQGNATASGTRRFLSNAFEKSPLNLPALFEIVKATSRNPEKVIRQFVGAQLQQFGKAWEDVKQNRPFDAATHALYGLLPGVGPGMDAASEQVRQGDTAGGVGSMVGVVSNIAAPAGIARATRPTTLRARPVLRSNLTPEAAAAVQFGESRGIPIDAGTATGRPFVKNVQKKVGGTWGGANTVETAQANQAGALARVGRELADQTNPKPNLTSGAPVQPVQAGESVRQALESQLTDFHQTASTAYDTLRQLEANAPAVTRSPSPGAPVQSMRMAVDVRPAKAMLKPIYARLVREAELVPLQGGKARALTALDRLMNGPDFSPLSVTDEALGDLKALSRGAELPELRTQGQGVAAQAVKALDAQVRRTAAREGPHVLKALEDGRSATVAKYGVADVLDLFGSEPKGIFDRLTRREDGGLEALRAVQRTTPDQIPTVARALMEDLLDKPTSEGGFKFADGAQANWQRLGSETKRILFPKQGQVAELDAFFRLAKKIGENPNPSGTAQTLNATNLVAGIPSWAIAKMLYTPAGVRALTRAATLSLRPPAAITPAMQAAAIAELVTVARDAGVPVGLPKAADRGPTTEDAERTRGLGR